MGGGGSTERLHQLEEEVRDYKRAEEERKRQAELKKTALMDHPWRKQSQGWDAQVRDQLWKYLDAYKPDYVRQVNAIMVGPVSAGKSSVINTLQSTMQGEVINSKAQVGTAATSLTTVYRWYNIMYRPSEGQAKKKLKFGLLDTMGLSRNDDGIDGDAFEYTLDGKIKVGFDFSKRLNFADQEGKQHPIHMVLMVLDAGILEDIAENVVDKLKKFQKICAQRNLPMLVLLTHIDNVCEHVAKDASTIYRSPKVQKAVQDAAALVGVAINNVCPIKNYSEELEPDNALDVLTLQTFQKMTREINSYLDNLHADDDDED